GDRFPPMRPPLAPCSLKNRRTSAGSFLIAVSYPRCGGEPHAVAPKWGLGDNSDMRCAVYARVSTQDQTAENQLLELRRYVDARGWTAVEYVDHGVSGAKDRRPALDQLLSDARRRKVQAVVCGRLDRLGRNLRRLILLIDEWESRGSAFITMGEGIDTSTAAGRLVAGVLGAIAQFERARIQERVVAGLARARAQG